MTKTLNINQVLGSSARYVDEKSAAALEMLPASSWSALVAASEEIAGPNPGIDCSVVVTNETVADFDAARQNHWSQRGTRTEFNFYGLKAVKYEDFQLRKGATRARQIVVDLGAQRVALI